MDPDQVHVCFVVHLFDFDVDANSFLLLFILFSRGSFCVPFVVDLQILFYLIYLKKE